MQSIDPVVASAFCNFFDVFFLSTASYSGTPGNKIEKSSRPILRCIHVGLTDTKTPWKLGFFRAEYFFHAASV